MTPRRIGWFLSLQDVLLTMTVHIVRTNCNVWRNIYFATFLTDEQNAFSLCPVNRSQEARKQHFCCILWIEKARATDKTYEWGSVRWETKSYSWGIYMTHIHWVPRQNKRPRDKDEVNKREIHECDGRSHIPNTVVAHRHPKPLFSLFTPFIMNRWSESY